MKDSFQIIITSRLTMDQARELKHVVQSTITPKATAIRELLNWAMQHRHPFGAFGPDRLCRVTMGGIIACLAPEDHPIHLAGRELERT